MKKRIIPIILALVMATAILPMAAATEPTKTPVGMNVMGFNTTDIYGNNVDSSIIGEYELTFMNLWATWCGPCTSEMPHIQQMYEEYEPLGLNVLGILSEGGGCTPETAATYCQNNGITYNTLRADSVLASVVNNSGGYIPVSYVVNKEGLILDYVVGSMSYQQMLDFVMPHFPRPEPEAITMVPDTATVEVDRMIQLSIEYSPVNAERIPAEWTSSNDAIATVNNGGLVTGVSAGTVTITATLSNGLTDTATVEVTAGTGELEYPYYQRTEEIEAGKSYLVVANYNGIYTLMTGEEVISGRMRLKGYTVAAEDMALTEDGIVFLTAPEVAEWVFTTNADDAAGFDVMNAVTQEFLSTIRNNGIYRLATKSRSAVYWYFENGRLAASADGYTDDRQFVSYFADEALDTDPNFDLLNTDHDDFIDIMIYTLVTGEEDEYEVGDVNMNGGLDTGDAAMVLRSTVGLITLTPEQEVLADFNEDDVVNTGDASAILRASVGL